MTVCPNSAMRPPEFARLTARPPIPMIGGLLRF